jgi:hypothetical protein
MATAQIRMTVKTTVSLLPFVLRNNNDIPPQSKTDEKTNACSVKNRWRKSSKEAFIKSKHHKQALNVPFQLH